MTIPVFFLQIAYPDGTVAQIPAGGRLELDFIIACTDAVVKRGVGIFRTEAHVRQAINDGIVEALRGLKKQSVYAV